MTDLDLPSLEIGRYVDLLKRRRWQLVPIGLLGLLVGFIVAWSIPRYYVANTKVQLYPQLLGGEFGGYQREDPFLREVRKARNTIKNYELVKSAIESLGWEEYFAVRGEFQKEAAYVWEVVSRVEVLDLDPSENRSSALLEISFRDQDPVRAAEFTNTLRDAYLEGERESILGNARAQLNLLQGEEEKARQALDTRETELKLFQQRTGFLPDTNDPASGRQALRTRQEVGRALEQNLQQLDQRIAGLEQRLENARDKKQGLQPRVPVKESGDDPLVQARIQLTTELAQKRKRLGQLRPAHRDHKLLESEVEALEGMLEEVDAQISAKGLDKAPNPEFVALQKLISEMSDELAGLKAERTVAAANLALFEEEQSELPDILQTYQRLQAEVDSARDAVEDIVTSVRRQRSNVVELENGADTLIKPIAEAYAPLAPTYPNRLLLTLIGLGIGVAFALVAIIALDVLQPTWKSLDEVARGLGGLPALGGVAHLDLPEDIAAARRRRARYAIAGSVFAVLVGAIVAIYFWEPLRLPEAVRVVLDGFLGGQG